MKIPLGRVVSLLLLILTLATGCSHFGHYR